MKASSLVSCLLLAAAAAQAQVVNEYWSASLTATNPSGIWENPDWSTSSSGATPGTFVEGGFPIFSAGSAATGSYTITANANHTIAGAEVTPTTGTVTLTGPGVLSIASGTQGVFSTGTLVISNSLGGAGGLEPQTGTLALYGYNTYSGGTFLDGTLIYFNNNNSFGTGPITPILAASTVEYSALLTSGGAALTITNAFDFGATNNGINFVPTGSPLTCSGPWNLTNTAWVRNNGSPAAALILSGALSGPGGLSVSANNNGVIIVSGANSYTGQTLVGGGNSPVTLSIGADNNLGAVPATFTPASLVLGTNNLAGILLANDSFTLSANRGITLDASSTIEAATGSTLTCADNIATAGYTLTFGGSGALGAINLTASNTFNDGVIIYTNSSLEISGSGDLGDNGGGSGSYNGSISDYGSFVYNSSAPQILYGSISGSGSLAQAGPGTLTLNAYNNYTGATTISGGTLALGGGGSINGSSIYVAAGATFDVSAQGGFSLNAPTVLGAGGSSSPAVLNGASGGSINLNSQPITLTYDGSHAPLTITWSAGSAGSLYLNGNPFVVNNTGSPLTAASSPYVLVQTPAGTSITPGTYPAAVTGNGMTAGDTAYVVASGNVLELVVEASTPSDVWNGGDFNNSPDWSDGGNWLSGTAPNPAGDNVHFAGATGTAPVLNSSYNVNSLNFDSSAAAFSLSGSTLSISGGLTNNSAAGQTLQMPVALLGGPSQWSLNNGSSNTVTAAVSDTGGGLTLSGNGLLNLTANNPLTGPLTTEPGSTLVVSGNGDLGDSSGQGNYPGAISDYGTLIFNTSTPQVFSGALTISGGFYDTNSSSQTFSGPITVNGSFIDNNSGSQTLAGSLTINGVFTDVTSTPQTLAPAGIVDNGMLNYNGSYGPVTLSQIISGTGAVTENGPGQLNLTGANTYTGVTTINNAELAIQADDNLGAPPASFVPNQITLNNNMTAELAGGYTYGLRVQNANVLLNANRGIFLGANGGCIDVAGGYTVTIPGAISGTGPFYSGASHSVGYGTVLFSNANNTYSGPTVIAAGWLTLGMNNALPLGTPLTIASSSQAVNYGSFFNMNGFSQTIGPLSSSPGIGANGVGFPAVEFGGSGGNTLTIYQTNANTAFTGVIGYQVENTSGNLVITVPPNGVGSTLTLNDTNNLTGSTTITMAPGAISGPTLALGSISPGSLPYGNSGFGSISNTPNIFIGAGGTLDVSGLGGSFFLSTSNSLSASGTGTSVGTSAAAINGASGQTISFGSRPVYLNYSPSSSSGDSAHPALYIPQGVLALNGNLFVITNASANPLGAGSYTIILDAGGNVVSSGSFAVNVAGNGIAAGFDASIVVSGGGVNLVVSSPQADIWDGAAGSPYNWSVAGQWAANIAPNASGDNVSFGGTTGLTPIMNASYSVNSLTFNSGAGAFNLTNSGGLTLSVGSGGVTNNSTSAQTISTPVKLVATGGLPGPVLWSLPNPSGSITVSNPIYDSGNGLAVSGPGALILKGTNNYSGPTVVGAGGLLILTNSGELTSGTTAGTYASPITNNGSIIWDGTASETLSGVISGSGSLSYGPNNGATLTLSAINTYTGQTVVSNGSLVISKDSSLGAAPAAPVANQLVLNNNMGSTFVDYGLRDTGGNFTLAATRGITLGPLGGSINVQNAYTIVIGGVITGPGNFWASPNSSAGYGTIVFSNVNTYTGATYVAAGTLTLGVNNAIPTGSPLNIGSSSSSATAGSFFNMNGMSATIGPLSANMNGYTNGTSKGAGTPTLELTGPLTIYQTNITSVFGGIINGSGGSLTLTVPSGGTPGELILTNVNTYTGNTTINGGTLGLSGVGSINNSPSIAIGAGGTFDVSGLASTFTLNSSTSFSASGIGAGASAATINGSASLGSQPISLTYSPASRTGDSGHPALYVSNGTLTLNGNTITVNNASGAPLGSGTYTLIQQGSGSLNVATMPVVNVTGGGLGAGAQSSVQVSGGSLNLVVTVPTPTILGSSVHVSGGSLTFSGSGGPANGNYSLLTTTNLVLPVSQWQTIATGSFDNSGNFNVNTTVTNTPSFYLIAIP